MSEHIDKAAGLSSIATTNPLASSRTAITNQPNYKSPNPTAALPKRCIVSHARNIEFVLLSEFDNELGAQLKHYYPTNDADNSTPYESSLEEEIERVLEEETNLNDSSNSNSNSPHEREEPKELLWNHR